MKATRFWVLSIFAMATFGRCGVEMPADKEFAYASKAEREAAKGAADVATDAVADSATTDADAQDAAFDAPDGTGDAALETAADAAAEVAADSLPDTAADSSSDAVADAAADSAPETAADGQVDAGMDTGPDSAGAEGVTGDVDVDAMLINDVDADDGTGTVADADATLPPTCTSTEACADGNPCTDDACDPKTGCVHSPNAATCTDDNACTIGDACKDKSCVAGPAPNCDDKNACTDDKCDPKAGCVNVANSATCTDDNVCTAGDGCKDKACAAGKPVNCDDGNACTDDSCDPKASCVQIANTATCTDGNACTVTDVCAAKACKAGPLLDSDGDGAVALSCGGADCDDSKANINPSATEVCGNGIDENCNGATDEGCVNAVGCPSGGSGTTCANGQGVCDSGHCLQTDAKGHKWTLVPAGKFWMGCNAAVDSNCSADEKPQHEVSLSAYWIGVFEVTAAQYKTCATENPGGCTAPSTKIIKGDPTFGAVGKDSFPVNYVSRAQSQAVCKWLGGDLPTEAQWEKAARGGCDAYAGKDCKASEVKFPWGGAAPVCGQQAVFDTGGGKTCGQAYTTYATGGGSALGKSPYGAYDMAGNVYEWTVDLYDPDFYTKPAATAAEPVNLSSGSDSVFRGGSFADDVAGIRASHRNYATASYADGNVGVRCAKPMLETLCDDKDDNGNGKTDEGCDDDGDGYCDGTMTTIGKPSACPSGAGDCDDTKATSSPAAAELCSNTIDDNCNGATDEADCVNAVGCPPVGKGTACGKGQGVCDSGHCLQTDAKGHKWTLVPAGKFWMGCNAALDSVCTGNVNENPQHEVDVSAFWVGVYEVTASQYQACVAAGGAGCTMPAKTGGSSASTYATSGKEQHPINYIDWSQAKAMCKWLGGDVPTEAQWEKAARGGCEVYAGQDCKTSEAKYPWGNADPVCGTQAVFYTGSSTCSAGGETTYAAGEGSAQGASPYGAYDMAGNVWEWTMDWYDVPFYSKPEATKKDPVNLTSGSFPVVRGGNFGFGAPIVRAAYRTWAETSNLKYVGVRCAKPAQSF